jgi:hypothetical protein
MTLMSPDSLSSTGWSPYRGSLPVPNIPCPVLSTSSGLLFETLEEVKLWDDVERTVSDSPSLSPLSFCMPYSGMSKV